MRMSDVGRGMRKIEQGMRMTVMMTEHGMSDYLITLINSRDCQI
jgi:hypothetical protein